MRYRKVQIVCLVVTSYGTVVKSSGAAVIISDPAVVSPSNPDAWDENTHVGIGNREGSDAWVFVSEGMVITQAKGSYRSYVGSATNATGRLTVTEKAHVNLAFDFYLGYGTGSMGILEIYNGGKVTAENVIDIGYGQDSVGIVNIDNGWLSTKSGIHIGSVTTLNPGASRCTGAVMLTNGSTMNAPSGITVGNTSVSSVLSGSTVTTGAYSNDTIAGTALVSGAGTTWTTSSSLRIEDSKYYHQAKLTVTDGGTVNVGTLLSVGAPGYAMLEITNGNTVVSGSGQIGGEVRSAGVVVVDGSGSSWTNKGTISMGCQGSGALMVRNGGLVAMTSIKTGTGVVDLEFDGGTLKAQESVSEIFSGTYNSLKLTGGGMTMQIDSGLSIGMGQVFTGDGGMNKTGSGTLTLSTRQEYTGLTVVREGTLAGTVSLAGGLVVRNGGTFAPGAAGRSWIADMGGFTLDRGGILALKIGGYTDSLLVDGDVMLNGTLALVTSGTVENGSHTLIINWGDNPVHGTFSDIMVNGAPAELHSVDGLCGGGWFEINGKTFALSYGGQAYTGSLHGGHDVILNIDVKSASSHRHRDRGRQCLNRPR